MVTDAAVGQRRAQIAADRYVTGNPPAKVDAVAKNSNRGRDPACRHPSGRGRATRHQQLADRARLLRDLGMSFPAVGGTLGVDYEVAMSAIAWNDEE